MIDVVESHPYPWTCLFKVLPLFYAIWGRTPSSEADRIAFHNAVMLEASGMAKLYLENLPEELSPVDEIRELDYPLVLRASALFVEETGRKPIKWELAVVINAAYVLGIIDEQKAREYIRAHADAVGSNPSSPSMLENALRIQGESRAKRK